MARLESISTVVEQERLLALVDTQRQHIAELRTQLNEALEALKQQQLQLVQQSPARRNVRKLLEQAAADNTTLANRVEELRAQRNALCVTKAALTAQVSELIRATADDRQRNEQHRLLHQLHHLCRLIQQPHLQKPEEQMAAVVAHIKQLYRERQQLSEKLDAAMRSNSSSPTDKQHPEAAAVAGMLAPSSPTGLKLDQYAKSQLIWTSRCPDPFDPQQQPTHSCKAAAAAAAGDNVQEGGSGSSSDTTDRPAASCDTGGCSEGFNTAHLQLLDMSYLSPLRGVDSRGCLGRKVIRDDTPCSVNPSLSTAAHCTPEATFASAVSTAADAGTPLSAQSLSAFSTGKGPLPSPRMRKALRALSPIRRCGLPRTTSHASASGAASSCCSSDGGSGSCASRTTGVLADLLTPTGLGQQQQTPTACLAATAAGAACSRLTPRGVPVPGECGYGFGSSVSVASSKPGSVGLCLQPKFQLAAAADGLWPSPANAQGTELGLAAAISAVGSHRLWLQDKEDCEGGAGSSDAESALLGSVCPMALTGANFLLSGGDSCSSSTIAGSNIHAAEQQLDAAANPPVGPTRRGRRSTAVSHVLWLSASAALAAGAAAAWRHKHAGVLQLLTLLHSGGAAAAGQACWCVAAGVAGVRQRISQRHQTAGSITGCSTPADSVDGDQ